MSPGFAIAKHCVCALAGRALMETETMTNDIDATRMPIVRMTDAGEAMADSRDVAAYFGKHHSDVLKAFRNLHCSPQFQQRNFSLFRMKDLTGESTSHVTMTKDGFTFFVLGFTGAKAGAYKEAYIAAFNAMEARDRSQAFAALPDFTSPAIAARAWAEQVEGREAAQKQIVVLDARVIELAPKAEALDRIASAGGSLCITDAAKALQIKPKALFHWMLTRGWIFRAMGKPYMGYAEKITAGLLIHKITTINRDGVTVVQEQVRVTPKGLTTIAKTFPFAVVQREFA